MRRHVDTGGGPIVCASAGNFGQGMAYAARQHGVGLTVFAARTANPLKLERMRALGAELRLEGADFDDAKAAARVFADHHAVRFVEDSHDLEPTVGAGTIGLELTRDDLRLDAILIPLGNGALLAGVGSWMKHASPSTQVIGVCAAGAPAMEESWRAGRTVTHAHMTTIADGIGVRIPVAQALQDIRPVTDDIVLVEDHQIIDAMRLVHEHLGVVVEPSGAVGVAAIVAHDRLRHRRVATILCGGNLTPQQMSDWLR
jgi:threonine dehydratase